MAKGRAEVVLIFNAQYILLFCWFYLAFFVLSLYIWDGIGKKANANNKSQRYTGMNTTKLQIERFHIVPS